MPNVDNPHGLQSLQKTLHSGPSQIREFTKAAGVAQAIFRNDPVTLVGDGQTVTPIATPGTTRLVGVSQNYGAASTLTRHIVIVDPNALFEAQDNNDTDGVASADIGLNANLELNAGNAANQMSGAEIDESTILGTATLDVKLLALLGAPNNAYGANARVEVLINKHLFRGEVAGV